MANIHSGSKNTGSTRVLKIKKKGKKRKVIFGLLPASRGKDNSIHEVRTVWKQSDPDFSARSRKDPHMFLV